MIDRTEQVEELFKNGYNCTQALVAAYAPEFGVDRDVALKLSLGMGSGVVKTREICGAIAGMVMLLGLKFGAEDRITSYELGRQMIDRFSSVNGGFVVCRDLLGMDAQGRPILDFGAVKEGGFVRRPCIEYVKIASQIIAEML